MPRQDIPHENVVLPMPGRSGAEHARPLLTASENRLHRLANFRAERANFHPYPPVNALSIISFLSHASLKLASSRRFSTY
jgi:hypothetical protein